MVPLRPLRVGDVLDGALQVIRRYPAATLGSAVIVSAVTAVAQTAANLGLQAGQGVANMGTSLVTIVAVLAAITASALLSGVIVTPVERGLLGQPASLGDSWRRALARILQLLAITVLIALASALLATVFIAPVILLGMVNEWFYLLFIVSIVAIPSLMLAGYVKVMLAAPAIIVEGRGPIEAVRRSWQLSRGRFWPLLGTVLLVGVILYVISLVISLPITVISTIFLIGSVNSTTGVLPLGYYAVSGLGTIISGAITYPFSAAVISLLYFDQRMRTEGLDVELARQAAGR